MNKDILQNWRCTNDRNGNPRRLWLVFDGQSGDVKGVHNEGYGGYPIDDKVVQISSVDITPAEYASTIRFGKLRKFYTES